MERSGNFYKAIRLGYILISILIGCMAYNSLYEWQEIEALELGNKKIGSSEALWGHALSYRDKLKVCLRLMPEEV